MSPAAVSNMQVIRSVDDLKSLEDEIARHRMSGLNFLYRGQANISWPIQSTLFRKFGKSWSESSSWSKYLRCYQYIKHLIISNDILSYKPKYENEDFYILSMLRHLGFPCHLIDWSASLRTAIIFACSEHKDIDGLLWVLTTSQLFNKTPITESPFEVNEPALICKEFDLIPNNKSLTDFPIGRLRRFRQNGFMSIIPCKYISHDFESLLSVNQDLHKIIIPAKTKHVLMQYLNGRELMTSFLLAQDFSQNNMIQAITDLVSTELQ